MASSDTEPHQERNRDTGCCDEPGHRFVQVADVVLEGRAELSDLIFAHIDFIAADAEL